MMTKEEIQRDIQDLTYQYQALIREGSYKLAKIRKERIKKLREQLKQMDKTKVQDSMDILRLCGYTNDAGVIMNLKANLGGHFSIYTDGTLEYYDPFGNKKGTRKFPNPREAEKYVRENFAITKDSAIQVGPWVIYQEGNEISVHRGGRAWAQGFKSVQEAKAWIQKKERWLETGKDECPTFTKGSKDATTYKPGDRVTIAGGYSARIMSENNGTYIAQLPSGKKIELIANEILSKDDDATEHGSIEQYGKGTKTESMGLSDDPVLAQDGPSNWEKRQDWLEEQIRKLSKYGDRYTQQKLRAYKEEYDAITRRLSSTKDSDPKVAEAQAIINLCGGIF